MSRISAAAKLSLDRRRRLLGLPAEQLLDHVTDHLYGEADTLKAWIPPGETYLRSLDALAHGSAANKMERRRAIPIGVKDVIDVDGLPTRAGSKARADAPPCQVDAVAVARLKVRGFVPVGKTVTTEFAYVDPADTVNPFDHRHTPGGSSSGSAAAVGGGIVPLALGTQTAGSVCRPAAFCGTFAFKPTTGRTPSEGLTPFAPSFDTIGVLGLRLDWVIEASMAIIDEPMPTPHDSRMRVGVVSDAYYQSISPEAHEQLAMSARALQAHGHTVAALTLDVDFEHLRTAHRRVMQFEAHVAHGALLATRADMLAPAWRGALEAGARLTADEYRRDLQQLEAARNAVLRATDAVDVVLLPPAFGDAPEGLSTTGDAGLIIPWTYATTPLAVLPTSLSGQGLPLAVMLAGKPSEDRQAGSMSLAIARILAERWLSIDRV